jgi:phosphatidate cytidylyltransferase
MARVISALVFLPILIAAIWYAPPVYFTALVAIAVVLGLVEYYALAERVGARAGRAPGLLASAAILAAFYYGRFDLLAAALAALVISDLTMHLFTTQDLRGAVTSTAAGIFGVGYVALLGGYLIAVRQIESPVYKLPGKLLLLFFLIVFAGDTGAYYVGRAIGSHKLAPRISPGKTIEGAFGGLLANVAAALIAHYTFFPELQTTHAVGLALVMGALGQIGDLCESMLKRGAQAKDAGQIIPGHGGVLDRLDSLLFNAPVLYYFYVFFLRVH